MPSSATATNDWPARFCSPSNALSAAAWPACVAVEHVDQFTAKEVVVHHQSAQHRQVLVTERGAAGRDRRRHPGQVHRHHVGVALDDDGLVPLGDVALGQVDAEQHRRLLVQQRLRRVDVLGFHRVVVEQPPRPEPDHLAGRWRGSATAAGGGTGPSGRGGPPATGLRPRAP